MSPESIIKVIATANIVAELFIFFFPMGKTQDIQLKDIGIVIIHYFYTTSKTNIFVSKTTKISFFPGNDVKTTLKQDLLQNQNCIRYYRYIYIFNQAKQNLS